MVTRSEPPARDGIRVRVLRTLHGLLQALLVLGSMMTAVDARSPQEFPLTVRSAALGSRQELIARQPGLAPARVVRGAVPFVTVLCHFPDAAEESQPPEFFERLMSASYPGLDHYWRSVSYDAINLAGSVILGWYSMPHDSDVYRTQVRDALTPDAVVTADLQRLAEDCTAAVTKAVDWPRYYGINLVFDATLDRPRGGRVCLTLGGVDRCYGATWMWAANLADQATWAHEIGHTFGLAHSALDAGSSNDNLWDVMSSRGVCGNDGSYRHIAQEPIAFDKDLLGWISADRKFVPAADSVTTITLERLAAPGADGYLLAQIPIPGQPQAGQPQGIAPTTGRFYTVEARRWAGYDGNLPGEAVVIHEVDTRREAPARPIIAQQEATGAATDVSTAEMWTPGAVFRDLEHGIAVAIERATPTGFVVTIATRPLPWPLTPRGDAIVPAGSISFTWQPVADTTGYELEITPMAGPTSPISVTATGTTHSIVLAPGSYLWRVRAIAAAAVGPWTMPWEVTVARLHPAGGADGTPPPDAPPATAGHVAIAGDGHGNNYAIWAAAGAVAPGFNLQEPVAAVRTDVFVSYRPAGGGWGPPVKINRDPEVSHTSPAIAADAAGNVYAIWTASNRPGYEADLYFAYRPFSAGAGVESGWSASVRVNDQRTSATYWYPALAVDSQGNAYAAWIDGRSDHAALYFAYHPHDAADGDVRGGWSANTPISDDPLTSFAPPAIAVDGRGNVYVAWEQGRPCSGIDLYFAGRTAAGAWGAATRLTPNPIGLLLHRPGLLVDSGGSVHAIWHEEHGARRDLRAASCGPSCGLPVDGASPWGDAAWIGQDTDPASAPAWHIRVNEQGVACAAWPDRTNPAGCLALAPVAIPQSINQPPENPQRTGLTPSPRGQQPD